MVLVVHPVGHQDGEALRLAAGERDLGEPGDGVVEGRHAVGLPARQGGAHGVAVGGEWDLDAALPAGEGGDGELVAGEGAVDEVADDLPALGEVPAGRHAPREVLQEDQRGGRLGARLEALDRHLPAVD
jgi:hypothetical protein